jgi:hypothetical protein
MLNEEMLEQHIEQCKIGYLESYVNTLKIPSLMSRCDEGTKLSEVSEQKKEALVDQIKQHEMAIKNNEEQMVTLSEIYDRLINFQTQCQK